MAASSCKRARLDSVAASDESNSWTLSAGSQQCLYPRCARPLLNSERKFCGDMHRNMHMNNLAMTRRCVARSSPFGRCQERLVTSTSSAALVDSSNQKCMLPECGKKAFRDENTSQHFDFCGKKHMLTMVKELTEVWTREGRLCRLEECCRHVYVEEDGTCLDYCGMKHCTLAAARKGKMMMLEASATEKTRSSDRHGMVCTTSGQGQDSGKECAIESLVDSEIGYHEKIGDLELLALLKGRANEERSPRAQEGINIYDFHPWELVFKFGGFRHRYFVHTVTQQRGRKVQPQKSRKTKEGFTWKQSAPKRLSKDIETRYFTYMLKKPDKHRHLPHVQEYEKFNDTASKPQESEKKKCRWKMHEMTLRECEESDMISRKVVWTIFQEAQGEPVWPPCRQPRSLEGVPAQIEGVPSVIPRGNEILKDSCEGLNTISPDRTDLNSVYSLQNAEAENDVGRNEDSHDTSLSRMMMDICNTELMYGLDPRWDNSIANLDLCEIQVDLGNSGIAEESPYPTTDTQCLWTFEYESPDLSIP